MHVPDRPATRIPLGHDPPRLCVATPPCHTDIELLLVEVLAAAREAVAHCERALTLVVASRRVEDRAVGYAAPRTVDACRPRTLPTHNGYDNGDATTVTAHIEPGDPARCAVTPRELEVVHLIARGLSNKEIATTLGVSVRTVERHITNVYRKIGARGKADATAWMVRQSLH